VTWADAAPPPTIYNWGRGLTETTPGTIDLDIAGNGPLAIGGIFVINLATGLILGVNGALSLATATAAQLGGVTVPAGGGLLLTGSALSVFAATQAEAAAGTDTAKPITADVLQLGPDPRSLQTNAKTLVGAINEIAGILSTVTGLLTIVGTFDADADDVTPISGSPFNPGPLPPATAARVGFFVLVDTAGTPPAASNAPQVPMVVNDMVVCVEDLQNTGTYNWAHVGLGQVTMTAASVTLGAVPGLTAVNVQQGIEELQLNKLDGPLVIDNSLSGDGTAASPLGVVIVDGGTF
jgi:hypothetical protein